MKYEMIFGDEGLFFDAQKDCEMVGNGHHKVENGKLMVWNFSEKYWSESHTNKITISAMRRIIKEPKRWTWEDKKAGVLPEVGCVVMAIDVNEVARIAAINNDSVCSVCVVFEDGGFSTLHFSGIAPIETPAEKAQREEDEWVNKAWSETAVFAGVTQDEHDRLRIHLRHIYRAQLSGELAAPKGGE